MGRRERTEPGIEWGRGEEFGQAQEQEDWARTELQRSNTEREPGWREWAVTWDQESNLRALEEADLAFVRESLPRGNRQSLAMYLAGNRPKPTVPPISWITQIDFFFL